MSGCENMQARPGLLRLGLAPSLLDEAHSVAFEALESASLLVSRQPVARPVGLWQAGPSQALAHLTRRQARAQNRAEAPPSPFHL